MTVGAVAAMQDDGNLVVYSVNNVALWSTRTDGSGSNLLILQGDGNLVLYQHPGIALWHSATSGHGGAHATMQSDGNLVVQDNGVSPPAAVLWHAGTWELPDSSLAVADDGNLVVATANGLPAWYRVASASTAGLVGSSGTNTSPGTADPLAAGATGVLGQMRFGTGHHFRATVAAGETLTLDLVGARLIRSDMYASDFWTVSILDANGSQLTNSATDPYTTRITTSYTNNSASAVTLLGRVARNIFWPGGDLDVHRYALAIRRF